MKKMKKIFALLIAMVMVLGMSMSVFAATITVDKVKAGETYNYYKLMNYEVEDSGAYRYTIPQSATAVKTLLEACGFEFSADNANSTYVLTNSDALNDSGADAIVSALKGQLDEDGKLTAYLATGEATAESDGEAVFSNLETGLYFVTTTTGSLCSLATYDDQELIIEKQEDSTVEKAATETNTGVGETVHYTATINAKKGETITFTDTLGTGLTLTAQSNLSISGATGTVTTYSTEAGNGTDASIVITFPEMTANTTITITYSATVNTDAITLDEVENTATISYGDATSVDSTVTTPIYDFTISKVDGNTQEALDGVKFTVKNTTTGSAFNGKYYDGTTIWADSATELTTANGGIINVTGLPAGTYEVTETETINSYNKLSDPFTVTIAEDGTVTSSAGTVESESVSITVENFKGSVLPSTGGIGTTIFYIIGAILVVGAGVVLVTRRRMNVQ